MCPNAPSSRRHGVSARWRKKRESFVLFLRSSRLVRGLVGAWVVLLAVGMLSLTSTALLTDAESVSGNTFSAATVIIDANPAATAFNLPAMRPGDEAVLEITAANTGTATFRYAVTSVTTEDVLAAELILTVRQLVTDCTESAWDGSGSQLYTGKLGDTTTPGGLALVGDPATGADAGDRVLAASATEALCFHVELPVSARTQNTGTTATFTFIAEQTTNN